jgi:putative transposase
MSDHIHHSHNKTLLLYPLVFPAKYRREVFSDEVANTLRDVCIGIGERYEIGLEAIPRCLRRGSSFDQENCG